MKKILCSVLLATLLSTFAFGQEPFACTPDEFDRVKATKLLVVLDDDDSRYNEKMTAAFDKYWDFNEYQFIKLEEVEKTKDAAPE